MTELHEAGRGQVAPAPSGATWAALVAIPLVVLVGVVAALSLADGDGGRAHAAGPDGHLAALDVPPLDPDGAPESVAQHYRDAEAQPDLYREVPCFCGCEEFIGHRDLYDCFVRSDGAGWDAHAAGCGICLAESITVQELLADGAEPQAIRTAVIAQYGTTPITTPPTDNRS